MSELPALYICSIEFSLNPLGVALAVPDKLFSSPFVSPYGDAERARSLDDRLLLSQEVVTI